MTPTQPQTAQHTAGEWQADGHMDIPDDWNLGERICAGGRVVAATIDGSDGEPEDPLAVPRGERKANARLIASAPDLLEACKAAEGVLIEPGVMDVDEWKAWQKRTVTQLRSAINKAKATP